MEGYGDDVVEKQQEGVGGSVFGIYAEVADS